MRRVLRRVPGGGDSNYGQQRGLEVQPGTANNVLRNRRQSGEGGGGNIKDALPAVLIRLLVLVDACNWHFIIPPSHQTLIALRSHPVSYTHLTLPTNREV